MPSKNRSLFDEKTQDKLAKALQPTLFDLVSMVAITKQCHWNVTGPNFRPVHLFLDDIYETLAENVDTVAERLLVIGVPASGQVHDVSQHTKLADVPTGFLKDTQVLELMTERLGTVIKNARERMDKIEDVDTVTADLFHAVIEGLEKHHWMLRSHLV